MPTSKCLRMQVKWVLASFRCYLGGIDREKPHRATLTGQVFQYVPNLMYTRAVNGLHTVY